MLLLPDWSPAADQKADTAPSEIQPTYVLVVLLGPLSAHALSTLFLNISVGPGPRGSAAHSWRRSRSVDQSNNLRRISREDNGKTTHARNAEDDSDDSPGSDVVESSKDLAAEVKVRSVAKARIASKPAQTKGGPAKKNEGRSGAKNQHISNGPRVVGGFTQACKRAQRQQSRQRQGRQILVLLSRIFRKQLPTF
ncbi:hypothetical protein AC579_1109 [Pseudocercospora musae]|uniref:Uncharacterized protein n=1 Tax=Pseudocercospora musae TaxID=113226 RepID=A0A139HZU1_9PEZI|nr:hypothetical protein AC579_1109 [Pseudocercospora musae]